MNTSINDSLKKINKINTFNNIELYSLPNILLLEKFNNKIIEIDSILNMSIISEVNKNLKKILNEYSLPKKSSFYSKSYVYYILSKIVSIEIINILSILKFVLNNPSNSIIEYINNNLEIIGNNLPPGSTITFLKDRKYIIKYSIQDSIEYTFYIELKIEEKISEYTFNRCTKENNLDPYFYDNEMVNNNADTSSNVSKIIISFDTLNDVNKKIENNINFIIDYYKCNYDTLVMIFSSYRYKYVATINGQQHKLSRNFL